MPERPLLHGPSVSVDAASKVVLHRDTEGWYRTDDGYQVRPYHDRLNRGGQARKRSGWIVYYTAFLTVDEDCQTLADVRAAIAADRARRAKKETP